MLSFGIQVKGLVSDRASALIKLGKPDYLNVGSMADLFHFAQDMGKAAGMKIGSSLSRAQKKLKREDLKEEDRALLKEEIKTLIDSYSEYRQEIEKINKTVHPFDENNELQCANDIEKELTKSFVRISHSAGNVEIEISTKQSIKILNQIPEIAAGVQAWQSWMKESVEKLLLNEGGQRKEQLSKWIVGSLMPFAYWQINLPKTQSRAKNKNLRQYYADRVEQAKIDYEQNDFTTSLSVEQKKEYMAWAMDMARKFQRSSSRVEGRNGYLAFVHHAHKGIPKKRLEVLTVVHNHDIRGVDGQSSADRLFKRKFPDLFEFVLENVTRFPEPRGLGLTP